MNFDDLWNKVEWQESRGLQSAVSPVGAEGVAQLMPGTIRDPGFGVRPYDFNASNAEVENRRVGQDYLRALIDYYGGDTERALAAYNWGHVNASSWDGNRASLPAETRKYVNTILGPGNSIPKSTGWLTATNKAPDIQGKASSGAGLSAYAEGSMSLGNDNGFESVLGELPNLLGLQQPQQQGGAIPIPQLQPIRAEFGRGYLG